MKLRSAKVAFGLCSLSVGSSLFVTGCGSSSVSRSFESEAEKPLFTCSQVVPGSGGTNVTIKVLKDSMEVLRALPNARFAPLQYSVKEDDTFDPPAGEPQFRCAGEAQPNNYMLSIRVFEDKLVIIQTSDNTLFKPLQYSIKPKDALQQRTFSEDKRPVDGALTELILVPAGALFDVNLRTTILSRETGEESTSTDSIATRLDCTFAPAKIVCAKDARPVDGAKTELELTKEGNTWSALLRTTSVDRRNGREVVEEQNLASELEEVQ